MSKLDDVIAEMKKIGYTDDKLNELSELVSPEVEDVLFGDLADKCTDEEIKDYEKRIRACKSMTDYDKVFEDMAKKAYGDQFKQKLEDIYAEVLGKYKQMTLEMRDAYKKFMDKDPETLKKMNDFANSEEGKKLKEELERDGMTFGEE